MIGLIAAITIATLAALVGGLSFARARNWRSLARGLGIAAISLGLYFMGVMTLIINGVMALISWIQTTAWTQQMTNAGITIGAGILLLVFAGLLPPGRASTPSEVDAPQGKQLATPAQRPAGKQALDPEDQEIEALLRSRGIQ